MRRLIFIIGLCLSIWYGYIGRTHSQDRIVPEIGTTKPLISLTSEPESGTKWLIEQLDDSTKTVQLVMYQFTDPEVAAHLVTAAKRGVAVQVLLNNGYRGQGSPDNAAAYSYLVSGGVKVHWTPGCFDLTHEKSVLIDSRTLDVMTLNLTPKYYASGREFAVIDHDTDDIEAAGAAFESDWQGGCEIARTGNHLVWSPGAKAATLKLIDQAERSLEIYNEEMADPAVTQALEAAAGRGVAVRVCMTYTTSWRKPFDELTARGVMVRTYSATADRYIHAKMIVADGGVAFVGSQNFSEPSLEANRELGIITSDTSVLTGLEASFELDWDGARPYGG